MFKKKFLLFLINSFTFSTLLFNPTSILSQEKSATAIISSIPLGATILIDGEAVGKTPLEVKISVGKHAIMAVLKDYEAWQGEIEITEGENAIDIPPLKKKAGADPGEPTIPTKPQKTHKPWYKKPLIWGIASAAIIGPVIYLVTQKGDEKTKDLTGPPDPPPGI